MPLFNPFSKGKNALTLFDIRLENDFLVFRGNEHESSGQLLKGVVALCVPAPIKVEDIHLRLIGTQRFIWTDSRVTPAGISNQRIDRSIPILEHKWDSFWGTPGKSGILEKGNYEFPFELLLPGDTAESVEGIPEASITYKLKATIVRGKWAHDLRAYKHVRVVRTLESSALEFLHAMSVENIWPNKIEYSLVVPQKAIVFGSAIPLETRLTPLLKGLELGDITIKLMEMHDVLLQAMGGREYRRERQVASWTRVMSREEHWHEMIEDTGQEGWMMNTTLDLPKKLGQCIQDVNVLNVKVRHKLKIVVALKNPDGHVSELRATLPLTIFISPNIPFDDQGNMTHPANLTASSEQTTGIAPPGYGEHVLDQLYDQLGPSALQTPLPQSESNSPVYGTSQVASSVNLPATSGGGSDVAVTPAALSSRLQMVSDNQSPGPSPAASVDAGSEAHTPDDSPSPSGSDRSSPATTPPATAPLSRHDSGTSFASRSSPEHIELCKVPSYATAMKSTRVSLVGLVDGVRLPDYQTAISAPSSPSVESATAADPLASHPPRSAVQPTLPVPDVWEHQRRFSTLPMLQVRGLVA